MAAAKPPARTARCVQCGRPADLSADNPWRPFCSERCRLLDLGAWFSGGRKIDADDELPDLSGEDHQ